MKHARINAALANFAAEREYQARKPEESLFTKEHLDRDAETLKSLKTREPQDSYERRLLAYWAAKECLSKVGSIRGHLPCAD